MCETLDTQGEMDWRDFFGQHSIIQLTAFIKKFLRELPEPLLTFKLHKLFMKAANDIVLLHYALLLLPKPNRDTFLLVLALLHWVAKHADDNKMDVDNLARVMTPNILYPEVQKRQSPQQEISVIAFMIRSFEKLIKASDLISLCAFLLIIFIGPG